MIKIIDTDEELEAAAKLATILFEGSFYEENLNEFKEILNGKNGAIFIYYYKNEIVGFSQVEIRHDYVEGTNFSPVGYLEGVYVKDEYRMMGIGRELVKACEKWAKDKNIKEFASDCELKNIDSYKFHTAIGFSEVNRIICFKKILRRVYEKEDII